ncbi:MAG: SPOR domain-containing protein [Rhodocyclaceae bacterium]|nr:SPOR domain-containing protein [Rhodocyclaceae bacterium]MBK6908942.1 SPOR domain-containing protein [Rhodocyclaceae bacterium]
MRLTFLILLLANLGLFVWSAGYLGERTGGREPGRLAVQLSPEKLRLHPPAAVRVCEQLEGLETDQLASLRSHFEGQRDVELTSSEHKAAASYWVAIPNLESKELAERKQSELLKLGVAELSVLEDVRQGPWLVVLGTFAESAAAQKLLDELGPRGVRSARLLTRESAASTFSVTLNWPEPVSSARRQLLQDWLAGLPAGHAVRTTACAAK